MNVKETKRRDDNLDVGRELRKKKERWLLGRWQRTKEKKERWLLGRWQRTKEKKERWLLERWQRTKEKRRDDYLGLARELRKLWNIRVMMIPVIVGSLVTIVKVLQKGLKELKIKKNHDHPSEIGQNIQKSPRDLWRLAVTWTLVKGHHLTLV